MKFKQHIPPMVSGVEPHEQKFNSLEELLNIDIVKKFKSDEAFYQYSLSDGYTLMAEYDNGYRWWAIGFVEGPIEGLPKWVPKYDREKEARELEERSERLNKEYTEKDKQRVKTYLEKMESSVFDQINNLPLDIKEQEIQLKDFALVVAKVCLTIEHHKQFKLLTEYTDYKEMKKMLSEIFPSKA